MISAMVEKELNVECKSRTLRRVLERTGCSYTKARPIPRKSATREEQEGFMSETNATLEKLVAQDYVVLCGDGAGVLRWNGGGYGWRRASGRDTIRLVFSGSLRKDAGLN